MRRFVEVLACIALLLHLAGCVVVYAAADLANAVPRATPLTGEYEMGEDSNLALASDNYYQWTVTDADGQSETYQVSMFGPVQGFFVAQIEDPDAEAPFPVFDLIVVRFRPGFMDSVSAEQLSGAIGRVMMSDTGLPEAANPHVSVLGDNANLNWAILQKAIVLNAANFDLTESDFTRVD